MKRGLIILKLNKYIFAKIFRSYAIGIIFLLSLLLSLLFSLILFLYFKNDGTAFVKNFQFYVLIFYCILLFLYILIIIVKLFSQQIEDNSLLLIITKPVSRMQIFISQTIVSFLSIIMFIISNILILFIVEIVLNSFNDYPYYHFYVQMILKLIIFTFIFSFTLLSGIIFLSMFFNSHVIFLIFAVLCSLFILGGLPSQILDLELNNIAISFDNGGAPINMSDIKTDLLFKKYLNQGLLRYQNLTTTLYQFFDKFDQNDLVNFGTSNDPTIDTTLAKRYDFYDQLRLENDGRVDTSMKIRTWADDEKGIFTNQEVIISINFLHNIISYDQLQADVETKANDQQTYLFKVDLLNFINDYIKIYGSRDALISYWENDFPNLLSFVEGDPKTNPEASYILVKSTQQKYSLTSKDIVGAYKNTESTYNFDPADAYTKIFNNPVYFALRIVENEIENIVYQNKVIANAKVNDSLQSPQWDKYNNFVNKYWWINKFNIFEHFNQLWTSMLGSYGNFWFNPFVTSEIKLDGEQNEFFSYPNLFLQLNNDNTINLKIVKIFKIVRMSWLAI
ncbi:ABC transporter permease [Spiroplasma eriocheiris]|uniref:ABC transporter permease n=1 Tax=Spiroplasma eriocheiris TaxID=315358 RepID=A0A0H3XNB2_9MOLU|nr:ABC transporter permease [Spiroplasma eriocheiris]AHF58249.1 putative transmembrane protein [Spiroplasma eriocheiris CCTCC M 207170]AKM54687.1 ABC transporter permease [Spiroplasma eriocheiris]